MRNVDHNVSMQDAGLRGGMRLEESVACDFDRPDKNDPGGDSIALQGTLRLIKLAKTQNRATFRVGRVPYTHASPLGRLR
jgi:hypothetical protein